MGGEGTIPGKAQCVFIWAHLRSTGQALLATHAAGTGHGDQLVARRQMGHRTAGLLHDARKFMSKHNGKMLFHEVVVRTPLIDTDVRTAYACSVYLYQHLMGLG